MLLFSAGVCSTEKTILDIALDSGFRSSQSFSRAFTEMQGMSPSEYRKQGYQPVIITVEELIMHIPLSLSGQAVIEDDMMYITFRNIRGIGVVSLRSQI